ncbi:hypothetical protein Hanom_Chr14g01255721 [Helianthus anomalus]
MSKMICTNTGYSIPSEVNKICTKYFPIICTGMTCFNKCQKWDAAATGTCIEPFICLCTKDC